MWRSEAAGVTFTTAAAGLRDVGFFTRALRGFRMTVILKPLKADG